MYIPSQKLAMLPKDHQKYHQRKCLSGLGRKIMKVE